MAVINHLGTDVWAKVREHYNEAQKYFPKKNIVGIFLYGSQNYGSETENSDVDTICIVIPTLDDLIYDRAPVSRTHICPNGEHIDFKDVRLITTQFRKQNMNFVEILFTDYFIANPLYAHLWNSLLNWRECIARYNPEKALRAAEGLAHKRYCNLCKATEYNYEIIEEYGYNPKALSYQYRILQFIKKYKKRYLYKTCITLDTSEKLVVQSLRKGIYNAEEAKAKSEEFDKEIKREVDEFVWDNKPDPSVDIVLNNFQEKIMKEYLTSQLKGSERNA